MVKKNKSFFLQYNINLLESYSVDSDFFCNFAKIKNIFCKNE